MAAATILASEKGDFFPPQRLERYHFRYQTLINYHFEPASKIIQGHKDAQDSHVDLQLARLTPPEGLTGDALRVEIVRQCLNLPEEIKKSNLVLFTGASNLQAAINQGKTSILPGIRGIEVLKGEPRWAEVLARQGLYFIMEEASAFFAEGQLTDEGKQIIQAINQVGLLLVVTSAQDSQIKEILNVASKPVAIISKEIPSPETMELIRKKGRL